MAPLRSRANRNQGDDETSILKGLPIRQWRLTEEKIGPPVEVKPDFGKQIFPELPLPRDFHMLPEISQQLLRKARAGQIYHMPTPVTNGKDDKGKSGSKDADGVFVSKKWTLVARDKEAEEPSYLAKRRKGLPATFGGGVVNLVPQTSYRTTKVKKYDAEGKLHVYEVLAPEGQQVEGEIVAEDEAAKAAPVEPVTAVPGTIVEGVGVVNEQGVVVSNDLLAPTPPRRKPPPPRRKPKKGPGRGKKKVLFEGNEGANGTNPDGTAASGLLNVPGLATERAADSAAPSSQGDTPMPDAGDDDEGSGSEGEDGEDGDDNREEGELSPSPDPEKAEVESEAPVIELTETASVPPTDIKEEQPEEDTVMTGQEDPKKEEERKEEEPPHVEKEEAPVDAPIPDAIADATTLPGITTEPEKEPEPELAPAVKSPSPLPPAPELSSASSTALAAHTGSPEVPVATSTDEAQIPGLPPMTSEDDKDKQSSADPALALPTEPAPAVEPIKEEPTTAAVEEKPAESEVDKEAVKTDGDGDVDLLGTLEATVDDQAAEGQKEEEEAKEEVIA